MDIKSLSIRFAETAQEEINALVGEMNLLPIAEYLLQDEHPIPQELKENIARLLAVISDLFSVDIPGIDPDPEVTLRIISRDINLARLLRERGLFRLYRLVNERVWYDPFEEETLSGPDSPDAIQVPMFMSISNPVTGAPFSKQEEFIGWFCEEAHVARSLAFMRLATIDKMLTLNFSLEDAFRLVLTKPSAMRETLNMVAHWNRGKIESVSPEIVTQVAKKVNYKSYEQIKLLAEEAKESPTAMEELKEAVKPVIASLLNEVAAHDHAKDAMNYVRFDVLGKPEISYSWDDESGALIVELIRKQTDSETGETYMTPPIVIPFVPDTMELPVEIKDDIIRRLPVKNRFNLD